MNTQNLDSKNSCHSFLNNYANITPVLELVNAESPSPGYQSGTSPQDGRKDSFMFKVSSIKMFEFCNKAEIQNQIFRSITGFFKHFNFLRRDPEIYQKRFVLIMLKLLA
jgi:hypothetical protein